MGVFGLGVVLLATGVASATPSTFADFAIYATHAVVLDRHEVIGGATGSAGDVEVNSSDVAGIYSGGNVLVNGTSTQVSGDIVAMGTVDITPNHDVLGSIHSSAPPGTQIGPEVTGPQTSNITGNVVALGDVTLENVLTLSGSVRSDGDLMAEMNGSIGQDAQANGEIYLGQNVDVGGNVVYGTQLTVDVGVSIAGSTSQGTTVVAPATFTGVSLPVPAALSGRKYASDDNLVLGVADTFCPWNEGSYEMEAGPDGAECRRSKKDPDLVLSVGSLAATYLGATSFGTLGHAGRIEESTPGALDRADSLFATRVVPWCPYDF